MFLVDLLEKDQPLYVAMPFGNRHYQLAFQILESCEQRQGSVTDVVIGGGLDMAYTQRQPKLSTLQRLALGFLITAQHQSLLGGIKIQADHVPEFLLEAGILRDFERARQVRLDIVHRPQVVHACRRYAGSPR